MILLKPNYNFRILGSGVALPDVLPLSNLEILKRHPETAGKDEKILTELSRRIEGMYGLKNRYMSHVTGSPLAPGGETSETLATQASRAAIGKSDLPLSAVILGSTTSARYTGSQAAAVFGKLGQSGAALEVKSGCSTSIATLQTAFSYLQLGYPSILATCAETLSKVVNPEIRETWFGFGDGAGAVILGKAESESDADFVLEKSIFCTDGEFVDLYTVPGELPPNQQDFEGGRYFMNGDAQVMKDHALLRYKKMIEAALSPEERATIQYIIPHQVNRALTDEVISVTKLSGKVIWHSNEIGNIGGASILYSLARSLSENLFQKNDRIVLMSVGGGLSYGLQVWRRTAA